MSRITGSAAVNADYYDDDKLRRLFNERYEGYLMCDDQPVRISDALRAWKEYGDGGPLLPYGVWRLSGGRVTK